MWKSIFCARVSVGLGRMTSCSFLPSMHFNTMSTFSKQPQNVVMFRCRDTVVYTCSFARNFVVTADAFNCIAPLISSCTTSSFFTMHLKQNSVPLVQGSQWGSVARSKWFEQGRKISRSGDMVYHARVSRGWGMTVLLFSLPRLSIEKTIVWYNCSLF